MPSLYLALVVELSPKYVLKREKMDRRKEAKWKMREEREIHEMKSGN